MWNGLLEFLNEDKQWPSLFNKKKENLQDNSFLRTVSPQKRKGDFLQYSDTKTACYSLFDDVLEKLQYGIGKESLSLHVCQCILILSVREIMKEYNSTIVKLLERVRNILHCMDTTSVHPQQTFILPLRVEHSSLSLADRDQILDIVSFLMTVCHCKDQSWEKVCRSVEGIDTINVKCVAQFLSGFALYKSGRYTEGISCLMEVLRSGDALTQRLKARIYNLIGKCFDKLEKYQLSIQMFKEALCADFSYLVPLYNTSLQYKKQKIADMELECLNLLVTALEMRDDRGIQYEGIDFMCLLDIEDTDISYVKALYSLSSRSMQLKRYDVAVEKYMSLLEHLKTWKTNKKEISSIPPLLQVHHETIEALLMAQKYEECVTLCDRVLMCYNSNTSSLEYSALSQTLDPLLSQTFDQTLDQSLLTKSQGSCNESGKIVGKRKFNELSQSQSDAEHYGDVDVIALKFKAAALVKMGDNSGCLVCLQRAIDSISSYRKFHLQQSMRDISDSSGEPSRKRLRIDADVKSASKDSITASCDQVISKYSAREVTNSSQSVSEKGNVIKGLFNDSSKMLELEQELYTMTSEILESMEKSKDTLHYNRLATQIQNIKEKV
ncbi:uncharacterized protein LOC132713177 isoform X2 [Ruditapes philippinarum]|uniref:uncharacterized protein LOC132713177 isoform X2 n=1 Tax=Ruditapes philippinarum TaxID=129788 RepID=UPI00295C2668|nr:uncharacterized protein LOC132713177 isoform X2 [Ruditapes philippinarum]